MIEPGQAGGIRRPPPPRLTVTPAEYRKTQTTLAPERGPKMEYTNPEFHVGDLTDEILDTLAADIVPWLADGTPVIVDFEPGNMTRYELVMTPLHGARRIGGATVQGVSQYEAMLLSISNMGVCYPVRWRGREFLDVGYVQEKWKGLSKGDAACIANLLMAIGKASTVEPVR